MAYGICHLSIVPVRVQPEHAGEMHTQLLYGDHFKVVESRKYWSRIRVAFDGSEGWIPNSQYRSLDKNEYGELEALKTQGFAADLVSFASDNNILLPVLLGSAAQASPLLGHSFEGNLTNGSAAKDQLIRTALLYLNAPYLWGGKTPFGIDCSGLSQMVYRINGFNLKRDAHEQATQGQPLSFIEESEAGDLAFFDNKEGVIDHVGIIMDDNYIIHAHGKVRIDRIDHTGIFNSEEGRYSHSLRVIKKIV